MASRQEEAENHWPGFVDALSTIVMVVTFLLIILGVVIFIIAQQIQQTVGDTSKQSEQKEQFFKKPTVDTVVEEAPKTSENKTEATPTEQAEIAKAIAETAKASAAQAQAEAAKAEAEAAKAESEAAQAESEASQAESEAAQAQAEAESQKMKIELQEKLDGSFKIKLNEELRQDRKTDPEKDGQKVRSEEVDTSKQITIVSDETATEFKANIVQSANAILTLIFDGKSVTIDEKSSDEISKFLSTQNVIKQNGKLEIRSYVNLGGAAIGERRRSAFYRAMAARNELLKTGIDPSNISIKVKEVDDENLSGKLKIYVKS